MILVSYSILPQNHFIISNFFLSSFMSQITSILRKIIKVRSKIKQYPVHVIVLRKPAQIRSKKTAQSYYLYLYGHEYSIDYNSPAYFCTNIIYLYVHNYRISVHHPCCKHHQKIPHHVTPLHHTTLHIKIHLYTLVHKIPPRNPAI